MDNDSSSTDKKPEAEQEHGREAPSRKINPDLIQLEVIQGTKTGDTYGRVKRPREFRRAGAGRFIATPEAFVPGNRLQRAFSTLKQFLTGRPLFMADEPLQRLGVFKALAVFGSDAISSSAYATEAALVILVASGNSALNISFSLALAVSVLLIIVSFSYRQTVHAYPHGGGSYSVTSENLGRLPGLVAASALLIDYVLTVAVSIVAGVQAVVSALIVVGAGNWVDSINSSFPVNFTVILSIVFILLMILANLRGIKESGTIFSIPTYLFVSSFIIMLIIGFIKVASGSLEPVTAPPVVPVTETLSLWLILRAFSAGAVAMSGTEAISNGVPAFKKPESDNAAKTITIMAVLLGTFYIGLSYLTVHMGLVPGQATIISQVAVAVFGQNAMYYIFQIATMAILVIAANTAFADFPRLSSVLAKDGFMPHQFFFRSDRLVFSTGIIFLGGFAALLVVVFQGNIASLINLYAIGVFLAFTLSESGMVVHWWKKRGHNWRRSLVINGFAAVLTGAVFIVVSITKFTGGGWIILVISPLIILTLLLINRHYRMVRTQLRLTDDNLPPAHIEQLAILLLEDVNNASLRAMAYLRSIDAEKIVLHVSTDAERAERITQKMHEYAPDLKLIVIESPRVSFIQPMISYVDAVHRQSPDALVNIIFPEFIPAHIWERILHNRTAHSLVSAFEGHPNVVVTLVPYLLEK